MKEKLSALTLDISPVSAIMSDAQAAATHQVELMLGSTSKVFELWQGISASWLQRRTEDMQIGMDAAKRLAECRDPSQATTICTEWVSENVRRLQGELSSYSEQLNSLTLESLEMIPGVVEAKSGRPAPREASSIKRVA